MASVAGYFFYVGFEGSRLLVHPPRSSWCFTPDSEHGWEYEAINYDSADDARLLARQPDSRACTDQGVTPGDELETDDGERIAGWYIPAGSGSPPDTATIVLVHGHGDSKSGMLKYAELLHRRFHLVAFDLRNHGRSTGTHTTMGVREQQDLREILDWLESHKGPDEVGLLGISMGGMVALNVADDDERVDAIAIDSTHATLVGTVEVRLRNAGHPITRPGYWAVWLGTWLRTGVAIDSADALRAVDDLGARPLLILQGGADLQQAPGNAEALLAAAEEGRVEVELHLCEGAGHGRVVDTCRAEYAEWVVPFFERALAGD